MEKSKDSSGIEEGILKFIEWLKMGKLEVRAYPSEKIHAKLYIDTIQKKSPYAQFSPYELYLKLLYEYFRGELNRPEQLEDLYLPTGFMKLKYQEEAVLSAKRILDESHRFRTESNQTYEKLAQICRGKRIILVSATPLNNKPKDILSQIKLFQPGKNSSIPNVKDLESFFGKMGKRLKGLDRKKDREKYFSAVRQNASETRAWIAALMLLKLVHGPNRCLSMLCRKQ